MGVETLGRGGDGEKGAGTQGERSWGGSCSPIPGEGAHPAAFSAHRPGVHVLYAWLWLPLCLSRPPQTSWATLALWRLNLGHVGHSEMSLITHSSSTQTWPSCIFSSLVIADPAGDCPPCALFCLQCVCMWPRPAYFVCASLVQSPDYPGICVKWRSLSYGDTTTCSRVSPRKFCGLPEQLCLQMVPLGRLCCCASP